MLGIPTHAYPIYEIAATLTLLALLWLLRRRMPHGHLFLLAVVGYAAIRLVLTSFRQETVILGDCSRLSSLLCSAASPRSRSFC